MSKKKTEQWLIAGILVSGVVALWAKVASAGPAPLPGLPVPPEPPK